MRSLIKSTKGAVDLGVILMIGIAFAALMVVAYIIWTVRDTLLMAQPAGWDGNMSNASTLAYYAENSSRSSIGNITTGFDDAVNLLLVAITIFILAIAIAALLMLRGR